jgi:dsRNA-specific ribonuclease
MSTASKNMVATIFEALLGAAYVDAGAHGLDTVRTIMTALGLTDPALLNW